MNAVVTLNAQDDEALFIVASTLGDLAQELINGAEIEDLPQLLIVASMTIAATMANAYERASEQEFGF